jgi:hypothetical protein
MEDKILPESGSSRLSEGTGMRVTQHADVLEHTWVPALRGWGRRRIIQGQPELQSETLSLKKGIFKYDFDNFYSSMWFDYFNVKTFEGQKPFPKGKKLMSVTLLWIVLFQRVSRECWDNSQK